MAAEVRGRNVSPRELIRSHLDRIERLNPQVNALVHVDTENAARAAQAAETAVMHKAELGPLHGVPVTIKSCIDVEGWPCEAGTRLRSGKVASGDAPLVARLKKAGAIPLGNSNTPELLMAYETDNALYGRTNNPWDAERTPGGSSGGESAAIAGCLSPAGVGSDGGGSIRIPAHFTGICGLKPTPGRIPTTGHFPCSAGPFALIGVVGPMARTVADLQLLFRVMAGPDDGDPHSIPAGVTGLTQKEARRITVGWFEDDGSTPVTEETRNAVRQAVDCLREEGFQVSPFRPAGLVQARQLWWDVFGRAGALMLASLVDGRETELSPLLKEFLALVSRDAPLTLDDLLKVWVEQDRLRARWLSEMRRFPALICPVCSVPAFRHAEREWMIGNKGVKYLDAMTYTQWFNILGVPAAVVPVGRSPEGLPIGVQVVGRPYEDEAVLAIAAIVEKCGGWRRPPI